MDYVVNILVMICIYVVLTTSLDLLIGYTGLLSLGQAAFFGVGAYSGALLAMEAGFDFALSLVCACLITAAFAVIAVLPLLRLKDEYFVLSTFGVSMATSAILENWIGLTNGPFGLFGIPMLSILGWQVQGKIGFLCVALVLTAAVLCIKWRLVASPFGLALKTVREDLVVSRAGGKNTVMLNVQVFAISAAIAAVAGVLLTFQLRVVDPSLFVVNTTLFVWATLFVGGCASVLGNILGPVLLVLFPEALRFIGLSGGSIAHVQQLLFGVLLIAVTVWRPQGIAGSYRLR